MQGLLQVSDLFSLDLALISTLLYLNPGIYERTDSHYIKSISEKPQLVKGQRMMSADVTDDLSVSAIDNLSVISALNSVAFH